MCGIIGVLSSELCVTDCLIKGLSELQNRGYDSMGVSLLTDDFMVEKDITDPRDPQSILPRLAQNIAKRGGGGGNGIAHSRWATHGGISIANAHPHVCYRGEFSLVHNGIIENHATLRARLVSVGVSFRSDTDSEVIVNLLSYLHSTAPVDVCRSIQEACRQLEGTFGLVIQHRRAPTKLFCIRFGSPLLVGVSKTLTMVVSEQAAFDPSITEYTTLNNHDLVVLCSEKKMYSVSETAYSLRSVTLATGEEKIYPTWTEQEIREQPDALMRSINNGSRISRDGVHLGGLSAVHHRLTRVDHLLLMGCGTSYHACLIAAPYFRSMTGMTTVQVCDGSEFDTAIVPKTGKTCMIVVSQSGETIDLSQSIQRFRDRCDPESVVLGVINVVDSLIATSVDAGVYTNCGRERGVASTKSFSTQVVVLLLIACYFSSAAPRSLLQDILAAPSLLGARTPTVFSYVEEMIPWIAGFRHMFVIGKGVDHCVAMEISLKIKEITYIHSEAYSSSSLKHGPFALLDPNMLVMLISTSTSDRGKIENAYQEVVSRRSPVLVIGSHNIQDCPRYIPVGDHGLAFLEANCVGQVLALRLSTYLGHNADYPRNLAKVVTVE
jgi:glucosamine--fructose-6-phosphate aminotransferase (isomerizing)